ncbi:DEKNAAC100852 [Brettanomyces naardenensis]|uniref:DEKNAAC100852 n=1 Tax=Brettanomyces naardenensis TaxID=13370 RepID=A0A448YEV0_BRENA|nr:DEKNAAC100852 [Brettanomyces naardenensis]
MSDSNHLEAVANKQASHAVSNVDSSEQPNEPATAPSPSVARDSTTAIEFIYWLVKVVVEIFFREISIRGSFNIPVNGPTLVVIAPHANQFLDAAISMYSIYVSSNRRTHFIEAAVSFRRKLVGALSTMAGSIPVERAQDLMTSKEGEIKYKNYPEDEITIIGKGTHFKKDCEVKGLVGLAHGLGNMKVGEIISDTELKLAAPIKKAAAIKVIQEFTPYKSAPRINNHKLFDIVFDRLHDGDLIAIAPEGGSHDRTDLLPLKPGVAIMGLGAVAKYPGMKVQIVPCGLNYFHPHKFRSRAVLDFGHPIEINDEMAERYKQDARKTVGELMDTVANAMKVVTVQSPDYETLQVIQAARRLYSYDGMRADIPLPVVVEMNRNLLIGYSKYKDDPEIKHLKQSVMEYNTRLSYFGLKDHQVEHASKDLLHNFVLLWKRLVLLAFYGVLCLPGTVLFSPVLYACKKISAKKQKEALANSVVKIKANDVLGSWKVLIALVVAPICYFLYSLLGTYLVKKYQLMTFLTRTWFGSFVVFAGCWSILVCTTYASLRMGEVGMDIAKSIRPLVLSLSPKSTELNDLKEERERLSLEVTNVINDLGPKVFPKFNEQRLKELSMQVSEESDAIKEKKSRRSARRHRKHHRTASSKSTLSTTSPESSTESLASSENAFARERSESTTSSVYSGFSEFDGESDVNGKLPNLSHVSIFADKLQLGDASSTDGEIESLDSRGADYTTGAKLQSIDLTSRVRDAVLQRNQAEEGSDEKQRLDE